MSTPISATGSTATTATTGTGTSATTSNATVPSASSIISSAALGIGTTVPISQVLTGLMQVESIPLTQLQNQVTGVNTEISAYGQLNSALSTFQQSLAALTRPTEFNSYTATSSNTAAVTASAVIGVQAGTYTVNTTQLAQAQSLATAGQASLNTSLTSGSATSTVTIAFGTQNGSTFTQNAAQPGGSITINSGNNTLAGLRDAINSANLGVTATIVNDGSNTPYHLVLTSNQTGANESMQVSVQGDSGLASMLTYPPGTGDTMTQTVKAQDANLTVNGLSLTSSSNSVGTAVPGLTLNLQQTGTSTVSVAANTSSVQTDIDNFVSAYNTLHSTIGQLTAYNPGGTNGPLIGDATTMQIQNQLQTVLASGLTGTGSGYSSLAAVGIGLDSDGTLSVDDTALSQALQSNPSQFSALFGTAGAATNSNVTFLVGGTNTQPGSYAVNITQPATNGTFAGSSTPTYDTATGSIALSGSTTIASGTSMTVTINGTQQTVNLTPLTNATPAAVAAQLQSDFSSAGLTATVTQNNGVLSVTPPSGQTISIADGTSNGATQLFGGSISQANSTTIPTGGMSLAVAVDGSPASITVPQGIYTSSQLATALQTAINTNSTLQQAGVSVNVTQANGILSIASASYGSTSSVNISGSGATQLFGGSATSTSGFNVAGTINGVTATGSGQILTAGNSGPTAGLMIQVTGNATGALGNVNYSQGFASLLNSIVTSATAPTSGSIASATNTLNTQVTSLQTQETSLQTYISQVQQQYTTQFAALNAIVVQMQSTASFLQLTFNPPTSAS
ncbi:flagellar filament capping protein FliD [Paraburkholderia sp. RP-4-7]|uniref:Flagellar hook-associated protein 2 n=1 Tax=Paraburkholderia polaris TaxID=2728848 RepID=A0A848IH24_9BURK|nr:flagellar filament capping protein FliD [Paraburkholderia polaris]NMM00026.1 flagellar filament capping protein FliD [Paraburkholderia polaris]